MRTQRSEECQHPKTVLLCHPYLLEELSKETEDAIAFNSEANEGPLHQDQQYACPECQTTLPLLPPCEEDECALCAEEEGYAEKEEDVTHCKQCAIEEEDQTEDEEEETWQAYQSLVSRCFVPCSSPTATAECYSNLCTMLVLMPW